MLVIVNNQFICIMKIVTNQEKHIVDHDKVHDMVTYASLKTTTTIANKVRNVEELDAK